MKRLSSLFLFILILTGINSVKRAEAIPAFARKYETSCSTCHVAFPKLTPFGEAFRLNGYRMPGGDEAYLKDQPVRLGAEAWKWVWPEGLWPSTIPGKPPLAIRAINHFAYERMGPIKVRFDPSSINVLIGGTLGESISFYSDVHLFDQGEIGFLNRMYAQFDDLLSFWVPRGTVHLKFGQFIPEVTPFTIHRGINLTPFALTAYSPAMGNSLEMGHHGGAGFNLEGTQLGIELTGIIRSRFRYGLGLVNGNGINGEENNAKDGYLRLAYKIGGMTFDGQSPGQEEGAVLMQTDNWRDDSVRLGVFGYLGGSRNSGRSGPKDLRFLRLGVDLDAYYGDLNLFGGYLFGRDETGTPDGTENLDYLVWFGQGDYVIYPWLVGSVRYERVDPNFTDRVSRLVPHLTILPRTNVKLVLETNLDPEEIKFQQLLFNLDFAF